MRGMWTKLHSEEIHNIVRMLTVRRVRWVGFVARMGKNRAAESCGRKARTTGNQVAFDGMILKGWEYLNRIYQFQNCDQWRAIVIKVTNRRVPEK
jgi:hypothetical protein